ncbi:MAG: sensor histidine kinase KdpD [Chloroflexi bacterium]|nr:sensor histidine kinase KdpD [Chloroflexota bacterium]
MTMSAERIRPNPDELLARVQAEEEQRQRGKLKIFLGYAAGVGKTYAMLEAARERRSEGVDVVAALVETHGRPETEALLSGLEVIPRKQVEYRETTLEEMDVDAVLARRPQLALVDELAHTNIAGSRHPKRYQDVEELLAEGIDVYTTLNIQHVESMNDVVAQITGVTVRETVPDRIIDAADKVEVVDLPPEELLQRLQEGKVYVPEQAAHAVRQFFRLGNLTALREMALRRTAERVDDQMRAYMETRAILGPWPAGERLLVCVSPSPFGEHLVRAGRRLADELKAEWFAVYVETAEAAHLSVAQQEQVARTLQLAEELGARAVTLPGQTVADTVLGFARMHNVTKIIVGQPPRPGWARFWRDMVVDQIIRGSGNIDVYVISGAGAPKEAGPAAGAPTISGRLWPYLLSAGLVGAATIAGFPLQPFISPTNMVMLYLLAVAAAAVYLGRGPAIFAATLSVLAFDFFFVPPFYTLVVAETEFLLTFLGLFLAGLAISELAARALQHAELARRRQRQTEELCEFSQGLARADTVGDIVRELHTHLAGGFRRDAVVLLPEDGKLVPTSVGTVSARELDQNELAVAVWAFRQGRPAGRGTDTLPGVDRRYLPLKAPHGVVGVLGIKPPKGSRLLTPDERLQLDTFASQAALAIERAQLVESARQAKLLQAAEKLQTALLSSISHDLRTPLAAIIGILSTLSDDARLDEDTQRDLVQTAQEEAERLNRLMGNLLDMTRVEAGALKMSKEPSDVQDLVGSALERLSRRLRGREVTLNVPAELPPVTVDPALMSQVLVNLLDNALKYSAKDTPIELRASVVGSEVRLEVADRGIGIPASDLDRVFDKFYRVRHPGRVSGTGLGLSICKGIVETHGGRIWAENREGGGTVFTVALPLGPQAEEEAE